MFLLHHTLNKLKADVLLLSKYFEKNGISVLQPVLN